MKLSKTISYLLFFTASLLSLSCTAQKEQAVFLEADLYRVSTESRLKEISIEKKKLIKELKAGNKNVEPELNKRIAQEKSLRAAVKNIRYNYNDFVSIKINPPKPPCPEPRACDDYPELGAIIVGKDIRKITAVVLDNKGTVIGNLQSKGNPIKNIDGYISYPFTMKKKYSGPITIQVTRTPLSGKATTYSYPATLR